MKKKLKNYCINVAKTLINLYSNNNSNKGLLFPYYRKNNISDGDKIRVSEQEAKYLFVQLVNQRNDFLYSVEVPTNNRYSNFSNRPQIHSDRIGRSGSIDLSLYVKRKKKQSSIVNIEFKAGQSTQNSITKDILKLVHEQSKYSLYFHVLQHSNKNTINSLIKKLNIAFFEVRSNLNNKHKINQNINIFLTILEIDQNKSRYFHSDINITKEKLFLKGKLLQEKLIKKLV